MRMKAKIRTRTSGTHKGKRYPIKNEGPQGYSIAKGNPTSKGVTREDLRHARYSGQRKKKMDLEQRMREQWDSEHRGDTDMSFTHSTQEKFGPYSTFSPFDSRWDTLSKDMPRKDMVFFYGPTDRKIYIGKGNKETRKTLKREVKYQVENYFTEEEVMEMGPLYIQVGGHSRGSAATCQHLISIPHKTHITGVVRYPHILKINKGFLTDQGVITHELIHAKRFGMKDWVNDKNREEKETELDTMARIDADAFGMMGIAGYYQHIPEVKAKLRLDYKEAILLMKKYQKEDRKLILGNKPRMKGRSLTNTINKKFNQSHISRARFSPAEKLDRFFIIETKEGKIQEHSRYIKPISLEAIKKDYKQKYPGAKIWEIRDGSKARIV